MQIKSSQMLQPHRRLEEKFLRLKRELLKSGAMTVGMTENFVVPEDAAHFIPRLWEIGVDEKKLAQVLSKIYNRPIFSEKLEGRGYILKSSTEECPWVIVDDILFIYLQLFFFSGKVIILLELICHVCLILLTGNI